MPQLDPTWFASQLFWLAVVFAFLYAMLSRVILPPLMGILARREGAIASDLGRAQGAKTEAERAKDEYERTMAASRDKAQSLVAEAVGAQKSRMEQEMKKLDGEIGQKLADAGRKIEAQKRDLIAQLTPSAAEMASLIVEKLTSRAPSADEVSEAIEASAKTRKVA
jgi:F-type H+-transporting ATPase subunit b